MLEEESTGADARILQRSAAAGVGKKRGRKHMFLLEDSETDAPRGVQQPSGSDPIWLTSGDGNDESEEMEEGTCSKPSAGTQVAGQLTYDWVPWVPTYARRRTGTQGTGLQQRTAAEASAHAGTDRAAQASPAGDFTKEEPVAEACSSQEAVQEGEYSTFEVVERICEAFASQMKDMYARRREHREAQLAFSQALRSSRLSAEMAITAAPGETPPETAGAMSDVERAAAAAAASVVEALRLKRTCKEPRVKAEARDAVRDAVGVRPFTKPAVFKVEELSTGMPDREAAAGLPDQAAANAPEQAPCGGRSAAPSPAGTSVSGAWQLPDQAPRGSRAAAAPSAGAKPLHRRLTARKSIALAQPPVAPVPSAAAPAAFASPQQLHVEVVAAHCDEDLDEYALVSLLSLSRL